jgi:hypothetical protein
MRERGATEPKTMSSGASGASGASNASGASSVVGMSGAGGAGGATYVFSLSCAQSEYCCGGAPDGGALFVCATAQLARAAARSYLRDSTPVFDELHFSGDVSAYDEYAGVPVAQLREACTAQGLAAVGAADALRSTLREGKVALLRAKIRTDLLAAGEPAATLEQAVERALDDEDDFELSIERAEEAFFAGEDNADDFEGAACAERWNADGSGKITAPHGGSCCWGSVALTVTVTRLKVLHRLPAKKKA